MKCHVVYHYGADDNYCPVVTADERCLHVSLDRHPKLKSLSNNIEHELAAKKLFPSDMANDLLSAAVSVFTADTRIPRSFSDDDWTRQFVLHLPVADKKRWKASSGTLCDMLSFLTGDEWEVLFRKRASLGLEVNNSGRSTDPTKAVTLFSGGLDSFAGVVDLLENNKKRKVILVGHYADGSTSAPQTSAFTFLRKQKKYSERVDFCQFFVRPPASITGLKEPSMRSRSLLFLSLGVLVANSCGKGVPLVVAENGFISLNVPLTRPRAGSLSTRTTHPHFIAMFRRLLESLDVPTVLDLPYRFVTKGEMFKRCRNRRVLRSGYGLTMSCAHPTACRWSGGDVTKHCGYCLPCLVRRASLNKVGLDVSSDYNEDVLTRAPSHTNKKGEDLRALQIAIRRLHNAKDHQYLFEVLRSGPIPADVQRFASVFGRGLAEVATFLKV